MKTTPFDTIIDRRSTESTKWHRYGDDVLPLWIADMDFAAPEPVLRALHERVDHGVFGYAVQPQDLKEVLVERLGRLYGWAVFPNEIVFLPGVVVGFNLAIRAVTAPGDGVLAQTPVYYPILWAPANSGCLLHEMELTRLPDGSYCVDLDAFEAAITDRTRIFVLCNPHNPVGRVFRRDELERMAEICLRHGVTICADEIHCDLLFRDASHIPMASLSPEIAERTITLMAPSKTFNVAGLHVSVAIVKNKELREKLVEARAGLVPGSLNVLGYVATLAAYRAGQPWLDQLLAYLEANRDWLKRQVDARLPGVRMWKPEGTYLAWLDCRQAGISGNPHSFFLERACVAVNDGATFGRGGEGFVRLNFACPRATLALAVERMEAALAGVHAQGEG
jgi:cystathionine beta-lyase